MSVQKKLPSDHIYQDEATLLRKVNEWLAPQERDGIKVLRICDRYAKGYSDLFICVNGIFVCAELKDDTGKASPHQLQFIKDMQRAGAVCGVCRSVKDVADLVEKAKSILSTVRNDTIDNCVHIVARETHDGTLCDYLEELKEVQ